MLELFVTFFKLGLFTIGGGVAMIPILQDIMVDDKKWFDDDEMIDIIAICQTLPGVIAINLATYVGFKRRGVLGSFISTVGVVLPSFIIIILVAKGLNAFGENPYVAGALAGLRAAAVGLVIIAVWNISKGVIKDWITGIAAAVSFILIQFTDISVVLIVLIFLVAGIVRALVTDRKLGGDNR